MSVSEEPKSLKKTFTQSKNHIF